MGSLVGEGKFSEADGGEIVSTEKKETQTQTNHDSLNENQSKPESDNLPHKQQPQDLSEIGNNKDEIRIPPVAADVRNIETMIRPHSQLPKPEAPRGLSPMNSPSPSSPENFSGPAIGKFFRERSNSLSSAIAKRFSSLSEDRVTEFNLSGLKVIVQQKKEDQQVGIDQENLNSKIRGRISFFSRSNCRDCTAVRSFLRERGLRFVEINVDVYPTRERELIERMGSSSVPQIFFNEKLFGGLVALNSLRNSGEFDRRLVEMVGRKCSDAAPAPPVYGFDDPEVEWTDEMVSIIRVLRQRLPIQDRLMRLKIVKNCFSGFEMVDVMIQHLHCSRNEAVEIGKQLARKHFIHHIFGENDFEDGNHFYRFLEHEPFIPKCFNFRAATNDNKPKPAAMVGQRLTKIMSAILESYASEDRRHIDYFAISNSEEFRRYVNLAQDLHRVDVVELSSNEKLAFFLNLYNAMVIHAMIRVRRPNGGIDRRSLYAEFQYLVGGYPYSLTAIKNGILRGNRRPPYTLVKQFGTADKRSEVALLKVNPLIHFGLCDGARSSPTVRFFTSHGIEAELRTAAREFFQRGGIEVDLDKRTVSLTRIFQWFNVDFGQDKEILKWVINYLDSTKAGLLTHLLSDGGPINLVYQNYDWSVNS
ncbi:Glutaredoxin [Dillenia turbinata]|uniref:Glutaredoxin n=1 Tax=Dillenia turbinata TaxID=194707 RepID=A0AAN8Z1T1_9MAGN